MKIITQNFHQGMVKLRITDPEDLWYLSHLIDPGDLLKGKTTRKIKIGEGGQAKMVKKTLTLKIEAEKIELAEGSLRINGRVKEGPEDVPKNSYHTITLEEDSEFTLEKGQWLSYQKKKLAEAAQSRYNYLLCLFDREEALIALTKPKGYQILVKMQGEVQKKRREIKVMKDFSEEIIKALETYLARNSPQQVILASPAFYKEDLFKRITAPELKKKIVLATCSDVSEKSLDEVLKSPGLARVLESSRVRAEQLLVDELLKEIKKDELAVYGWKEVQEAVRRGAVSQLLLTEKFIRQKREKEEFPVLDELMKKVDLMQGEIHLISSEHEGGRQLDGLGGVGALLRYKLSINEK